MQAIIIWAARQDRASPTNGPALHRQASKEAVHLIRQASDPKGAARRLVAQIAAMLAHSAPSMALLQLLLDLVEIPCVKQVQLWSSQISSTQ